MESQTNAAVGSMIKSYAGRRKLHALDNTVVRCMFFNVQIIKLKLYLLGALS